jgi:hypothetical protein
MLIWQAAIRENAEHNLRLLASQVSTVVHRFFAEISPDEPSDARGAAGSSSLISVCDEETDSCRTNWRFALVAVSAIVLRRSLDADDDHLCHAKTESELFHEDR